MVPRKHVETVLSDEGWELQFRLGAWISNQPSRAASLSLERVEELSRIGMTESSTKHTRPLIAST
ncbi:helicase associated domain-containing protein [Streptomyces mirabilis]|uniref:helicase associated domain-containing protein n=1 Tax=Streptomyces mirabilis TaxID=68239 RepID=UPI0036BAFE19